MCLAATQLIGMAMARYLLELEPIVSATIPDLIDRLAPILQTYLPADERDTPNSCQWVRRRAKFIT